MEKTTNSIKITIPKNNKGKEWDYFQLLTIDVNIQDLTYLFKGVTVIPIKGISVINSQMVLEEKEIYQFCYNKENLTRFSKMEAVDYITEIIHMLQKAGQELISMDFDNELVRLDRKDNIPQLVAEFL